LAEDRGRRDRDRIGKNGTRKSKNMKFCHPPGRKSGQIFAKNLVVYGLIFHPRPRKFKKLK